MGGVLIRLVRWKFLANNGVEMHYKGPSGIVARHFVPAGGEVTLPEAAQILKTNEVQLHRLRRAKKLDTMKRGGRTLVPVRELLRLTRKPEGLHPGRTH